MSLMLRRQRDGKLRPYWYGEYTESNGARKVINLDVMWSGTPPESLRGQGDGAFERSRKKASDALARFVEEARHKGRVETLAERLIESKTGSAPEHVELVDMLNKCMARDTYSEGYTSQCKAIFGRFLAFMRERNPKARLAYQVRASDAEAFVNALRVTMSPATLSAYVGILRPAFSRYLPPGAVNPFWNAKRGKAKANGANREGSIHRKPFTAEQLRALLDTARDDGFMYPLIVTAACTGMRRGDVCKLKWSAVDLAGGMVEAQASKTGEPVEVPIFAPLRAVLEERKGKGGELVFPEAARMLRENADGLSYRFKVLVAKALDTEPQKTMPTPIPAAEIEVKGVAAITAKIPEGARRDRVLDTFKRYAAGQSVRQIADSTKRPKGTISYDLHMIAKWIGKPFVRSAQTPSVKQAIARITRIRREHGQKSASIYDWHALRTTFVTLALSAGVPMELVRRVTGHTTVDIVLRHYFRPGRDTFKSALVGALPAVLTGDKPKRLKPADELSALAGKVAAGSATDADKARLRQLAAAV
ncbi:MAG: tyrosine-type recombinase/integrase [Kiritimatiellia bacterium]